MPVNGLVTMTPTSVTKTGTGSTATINTNGSVTFSSCATLALDGVFSSSYDNYMIIMRHSSSTNEAIKIQFRLSGGTASTNAYIVEDLDVKSTTVSASRATAASSAGLFSTSDTLKSCGVGYIFGPRLTQPTAWRGCSMYAYLNASIEDWAGTHSVSDAYDGIIFNASSLSGLVTVYGFNQ